MTETKVDLIVIGGGVLGTFHAYHALKKGFEVALFEKRARPLGATVRNFGQIVPSGMNAFWQKIGRSSLDIYRSLQDIGDITVRQQGSIYIASDLEEMSLLDELKEINRDNEYRSELLTRGQCRKMYPLLTEAYCKGGLYFPEELSVNPRLMISRVQHMLTEKLGLKFYNNHLIREVVSAANGCRVIDNRGQMFLAEKVVICNGSDLQTLFPRIFEESDIELVKLQMLQLKSQHAGQIPGNVLTGLSVRRYEAFHECPSYEQIRSLEDPDVFWKQWGIHILFKQESDGTIILGDSHETVQNAGAGEPAFDIRTNVSEYILDEARRIMALSDWQPQRQWYGIYGQCREQDLFEMTIDNNIHIVTGIGGKGMTAGPGLALKTIERIFNVD